MRASEMKKISDNYHDNPLYNNIINKITDSAKKGLYKIKVETYEMSDDVQIQLEKDGYTVTSHEIPLMYRYGIISWN